LLLGLSSSVMIVRDVRDVSHISNDYTVMFESFHQSIWDAMRYRKIAFSVACVILFTYVIYVYFLKPSGFSQERWDALKMSAPSDLEVELFDPAGNLATEIAINSDEYFVLHVSGKVDPSVISDFKSYAALNQLLRIGIKSNDGQQTMWQSTPEKFEFSNGRFLCKIPVMISKSSKSGPYRLHVAYYFKELFQREIFCR
jgi:hypothetical protein